MKSKKRRSAIASAIVALTCLIAPQQALAMGSIPKDAGFRNTYSANQEDFNKVAKMIINNEMPYRVQVSRQNNHNLSVRPIDFGQWDENVAIRLYENANVTVISSTASRRNIYFWIYRGGILGGPAKGVAYLSDLADSECFGHVAEATEGSRQGTRCSVIEGNWYVIFSNK